MYCYIARQPIFDDAKRLIGYELLFRDGQSNSYPDIDADVATSKLITDNHLLVGLEKITCGHKGFINFTSQCMIHHFPVSLDPKTVVVEILETAEASSELLQACKLLSERGYVLALDDHDFDPKWQAFLPYIRIIKIDVQQFNILEISKFMGQNKEFNIDFLAEKVETASEFNKLRTLGFKMFQGYFFARPEMLKHKKIPSTKVNLLSLVGESAKVRLDFERVSAIIERDLELSYKLLRFVNSGGFTKGHPIASLKHAVVYLGESELKKFISLLALANLNENGVKEVLMISLIRARFCARVSVLRNDVVDPPLAFLTGLFSMIDVVLEQPLEDLFQDLPLPPEIKDAVSNQTGPLGSYLALAKSFESSDWVLQKQLSEQLLGAKTELHSDYVDCINWADTVLNE